MKSALPATEDGNHYVASGTAGISRFGSVTKCPGFDHAIPKEKPQEEASNV